MVLFRIIQLDLELLHWSKSKTTVTLKTERYRYFIFRPLWCFIPIFIELLQ